MHISFRSIRGFYKKYCMYWNMLYSLQKMLVSLLKKCAYANIQIVTKAGSGNSTRNLDGIRSHSSAQCIYLKILGSLRFFRYKNLVADGILFGFSVWLEFAPANECQRDENE